MWERQHHRHIHVWLAPVPGQRDLAERVELLLVLHRQWQKRVALTNLWR